jgi:hypothetical protein
MAQLFSANDIATLNKDHKKKRIEYMSEKYETHILIALNTYEPYIRDKKNAILSDLMLNNTGHTKTVSALIAETETYDFSKVNHGNDTFRNSGLSYLNYVFQKNNAAGFIHAVGTDLSVYTLWKHTDLLPNLACRLGLPENISFEVRSRETLLPIFNNDDVKEYTTSLYLVYRFK